jgi:thiol-disulfide isomerase/thioredoxin
MNNKNKRLNKLIGISLTFVLITLSFTVVGTEKVSLKNNSNTIFLKENADSIPYEGHLRIYIVEPESRWNMYDGEPYHYAFLDYAFNDALSIDYLETYEDSITWEGDVEENNVMAIAALFNPKINKAYAYPPNGNQFNAHYVDAAAGAKPGFTDYNKVIGNFTHTVLAEEGTATWCPYCPDMANKLNTVYNSGEYPFYFVALVADKNQDAADRLSNDLNIYGYPTTFFDGGKWVLVGSGVSESTYQSRIRSTGKRDVHELNLTLSVEWLGDGDIKIDISITNNEEIINNPPDLPIITGPDTGKTGEELEYIFETTDPEGDDIYYYIEWGDSNIEEWIGPYDSNKQVEVSHSWDEKDSFTIRVKSKDVYGFESDWATKEISISKIKQPNSIISFFERIFNQLPRLNFLTDN